MADKTTGGPSKGSAHGGDQTAMPGQAAGTIPFGIKTPLTTGAPGTAGQSSPASDPTVTSAPAGSVFGAPTADTSTGAPGTGGASGTVATGASYTVDSIDARPRTNAVGGSVDTEGQANKYGSGTLTGLAGHQPTTTGAPGSGGGGSVTNGSERIH